MSYKHILVAVDLTPESQVLIDKSVELAKPLDAELSFIHVDANYEELCRHTGIMDADLHENCELTAERSFKALKALAEDTGYPIKHCLIGTGEYGNILENTIEKYEVELVVCGHHHDFWGSVISSTKPILNNINVDMLIVPIAK